jgi:hypothetical protein
MEFRKVIFKKNDAGLVADVFINMVHVAEIKLVINKDESCTIDYNDNNYFECTDERFMTCIELAAMRFVRGQSC